MDVQCNTMQRGWGVFLIIIIRRIFYSLNLVFYIVASHYLIQGRAPVVCVTEHPLKPQTEFGFVIVCIDIVLIFLYFLYSYTSDMHGEMNRSNMIQTVWCSRTDHFIRLIFNLL